MPISTLSKCGFAQIIFDLVMSFALDFNPGKESFWNIVRFRGLKGAASIVFDHDSLGP